MPLQQLEQSRERTPRLFLRSAKREKPRISPPLYLKCWGCDYPYLRNAEENPGRWLPLPEESKAQRIIRSQPFTFQMK
jgi:hypothetical protein